MDFWSDVEAFLSSDPMNYKLMKFENRCGNEYTGVANKSGCGQLLNA